MSLRAYVMPGVRSVTFLLLSLLQLACSFHMAEVASSRYDGGGPLTSDCEDGSGFAYYESGAVAVCVSNTRRGKTLSSTVYVYADGEGEGAGRLLAAFDNKGRGHACCEAVSVERPRLIVGARGATLYDAGGSPVPPGEWSFPVEFEITDGVALRYEGARRACVVFAPAGGREYELVTPGAVQHTRRPRRVEGAARAMARGRTEPTMGDVGTILGSMRQIGERFGRVGEDKFVEPAFLAEERRRSAALARSPPPAYDDQGRLVGERLAMLPAHERARRIGEKNPALRRGHAIRSGSGKYSPEIPTGAAPVAALRTLPLVSERTWRAAVEDPRAEGRPVCLVAVADWQPSSAAVRQVAELALGAGAGASSSPLIYQLDLSEGAFARRQWNVRGPAALVFFGGRLVRAERLWRPEALHQRRRNAPKILLVERDFQTQALLERHMRRASYDWDLALGESDVAAFGPRLTGGYGVVAVDTGLPTAQLAGVLRAVARPDGTMPLLIALGGGELPGGATACATVRRPVRSKDFMAALDAAVAALPAPYARRKGITPGGLARMLEDAAERGRNGQFMEAEWKFE